MAQKRVNTRTSVHRFLNGLSEKKRAQLGILERETAYLSEKMHHRGRITVVVSWG